jgi:hypothetical protein
MLATISRHGLRSLALALGPAVVIVGTVTTVMAPERAWAQATNVFTFQCSGNGIRVDIRGLGTQNVCIEGTADVDLFCACATRSGNCPNADNKSTLGTTVAASTIEQPQNGRVRTTFSIPSSQFPQAGEEGNELCANDPSLHCGRGQTPTLIGFDTSGTTFEACTQFTTTIVEGEPTCTCTETLAGGGPVTCPVSGAGQAFADIDEDCVALFPELE